MLDRKHFRVRIFGTLFIKPRSYKTFFTLNSTEHEFFHANKSQITNNAKFFLAELLLAFSYLIAEKISFSAELSMKKVL